MNKFLLGNNTGYGFLGFYESELSRLKRVFLLKGAPGTGKSTLMKSVYNNAMELGYECEKWYCSGDTKSLDGIYVKGKEIAIVDATSPHTLDMSLPVIRDEIVNLADALDRDILIKSDKEIRLLIENKKHCYNRAYRYLKMALLCNNQIDIVSHFGSNNEKVISFCDVIIKKIDGIRQENTKRQFAYNRDVFLWAITSGQENFFLECIQDKQIIALKGNSGIKKLVFDVLATKCKNSIRLHNPINPNKLDGLVFENCVIIDSEYPVQELIGEYIYLDEFEKNFDIQEYNELKQNENENILKAEKQIKQAQVCHFELESIINVAMDFDVVKEYSDILIKKILG